MDKCGKKLAQLQMSLQEGHPPHCKINRKNWDSTRCPSRRDSTRCPSRRDICSIAK